MAAPAFLLVLQKAWAAITSGDKGAAKEAQSAVRGLFAAEENIRIHVDDHTRHVRRGGAVTSASIIRGAAGGDEWVEFHWPEIATDEEVEIADVRWRLYRSGLTLFNGTLRTSGGGLDGGSVLGHRIELRAKDGALLGALYSGFFTHRAAVTDAFSSSAVIDHAPLKLHFDELADTQTGHWFVD